MGKKRIIKQISAMIVSLFCLLNLGTSFVPEYIQEERISVGGKRPLAIIYIIEFRDILCSPCSGSFLDFCSSFPFDFQKDNTWGIIVFEPELQTDLGEKILEKKVRGFMKGNQLHFPVIIDFFHIFKALRTQATQLLLLDPTSLTVKQYDFPLAAKQKDKILQAVFESL